MKTIYLTLGALLSLFSYLAADSADPSGIDFVHDEPLLKVEVAPLIIQLYDMGALQVSTSLPPKIELNLKRAILRPKLLTAMADLLWAKTVYLDFDLICGVPFGALPLSTTLSLRNDVPLIFTWQEPNSEENASLIYGHYSSGDKVLLVEDSLTDGAAAIPLIQGLAALGLQVPYLAVFLDYEEGGVEILRSLGVQTFSALSISEVQEILVASGRVEEGIF